MRRYIRTLLLMLVLGFAPVLAQNDCPSIVKAALEATDQFCQGTGRNQACYGNVLLEAQPQSNTAQFTFDKAGDRVSVADIQSLRLSAFNLNSEQWGVALMQVQANIPDTSPQNVTFLLFGDVQITNDGDHLTTLAMTAPSGGNVRVLPAKTATIVSSLTKGASVIANGRNADTTWIRIQLDGGDTGWVSAGLLTSDGDVNTLKVIQGSKQVFGPMQAFTVQSGVADHPCDTAPDSGILIQTPEGVGEISLLVNEVNVQLGSTVFIQAQPSQAMRVNTLKGKAILTSQNTTEDVPEGSYSTVQMDANLSPVSPPSKHQPYDISDVDNLPTDHLPDKIAAAPPLVATETPIPPTPSKKPTPKPTSSAPQTGGGRNFVVVDPVGAGCAPLDPSPTGSGESQCVSPGTTGVTTGGPSGSYYRVRLSDGRTGWMPDDFMAFQ